MNSWRGGADPGCRTCPWMLLDRVVRLCFPLNEPIQHILSPCHSHSRGNEASVILFSVPTVEQWESFCPLFPIKKKKAILQTHKLPGIPAIKEANGSREGSPSRGCETPGPRSVTGHSRGSLSKAAPFLPSTHSLEALALPEERE